MDTVTTIEAYEKTPSGAHKITFLGGTVAGTRDDDIGVLAQNVLAQGDDANPVAIKLATRDGRLYIERMNEIEPPEELAEEPAAAVEEESREDVAKSEAVAPGSDPTGTAQVDLYAADYIRRAHVTVNEIISELDNVGITLQKLDDVANDLHDAAGEVASMIYQDQA